MMPHYWPNCLFITAVGATLEPGFFKNTERNPPLRYFFFFLKLRANCTQPCFIYQPSQVISSFIALNFALVLSHSSPPTFWGDLQVRFGSCDASSDSHIWQVKLYHLRLNSNFPVTEKKRVRFHSFFPLFFLLLLFVNSVSTDWFAMRWESHCPCLKVNTPLVGASWAALATATPPISLSLLPNSVTLWWVCTQYLHCPHAGAWWWCRGNGGPLWPTLSIKFVYGVLHQLWSSVDETLSRGLAFAFFFSFFEALPWQGKTPAGCRGFAEHAGHAGANWI